MSFITWNNASGKKYFHRPCSISFSYKNSNKAEEMLCQNPNRLFPLFWKQDIQNHLNTPLARLPSLLVWNGNKCYLGEKRVFSSAIPVH